MNKQKIKKLESTYTSLDNIESNHIEYETLLAEYAIVDSRIVREMDSDDRGLELNLVALSAVIVASSFIIEQKSYFLFLILTLPFYTLTWAQARRIISVAKLISYSRKILVPRLNIIIQNESKVLKDENTPALFISYEEYVLSDLDRSFWKLLFSQALPQAGKSMMQLTIASLLLISFFLFTTTDSTYLASKFDTVLLVINGIFFLISILALLSAVRIRQTG